MNKTEIPVGAIFISYRRADSLDVVGRIYDRLVGRTPQLMVFRDVDSIPPGASFPEALRKALDVTSVGLVVIGPQWLSLTDSRNRPRIDDPEDFVRIEIEALLRRGIPIIPCLVSGALLPQAEQLPLALRPLVERQSVLVRPDPDFHRDMDRLIAALAEMVPLLNEPATAELVIAREAEGWWGGLECNEWRIVSNDKPVLKIEGTQTKASTVLSAGTHNISVLWREQERGSNDRSGYWPGYSSSGQTDPVTLELRPGRHIFTLVKIGPDPRTWWRQFLRGNSDDRKRSLVRVGFEPSDWPMRDKLL
jgi:TIR domain-containing protein